MKIAQGTLIGGRYRVGELLGMGGQGGTYRAVDEETGLTVAMKSIALKAIGDWKALELFERQAKVLAAMDHHGVPDFVDYVAETDGDGAESFYLIQEFIDGPSLHERLVRGWHPNEEEVRRIAGALLRTLAYLHAQSPPVIHRDIKPRNVIMTEDGRTILVDFGAVKTDLQGEHSFASTVVGTYGYMAPEQFRGHAVPSSDLYGLGATLVGLLTGRDPSHLPEKRLKIDFRQVIDPTPRFASWLDELLEPAPEDRIGSATEALERLDRLDDEGTDDDGGPVVPKAFTLPLPRGSRIREVADGGVVEIALPVAGLRRVGLNRALKSIFMVAASALMVRLALSGLTAGGRNLLLSVAVLAVASWIVWSVMRDLLGAEHLTLTNGKLEIERRVATLTYKRELIDLSRVEKIEFQTAAKGPTTITIEDGIKSHRLGASLDPAETEWVTHRLRYLHARHRDDRMVLPEMAETSSDEHKTEKAQEARRSKP